MLKRTITELPEYKGRKGNIMSRNNYNFEKRAYGLLDITFCVPETICPVAYRHGLVARQSRKLRRTIWDAAYDAVSHRFGYGVSDSIDFNIFLGWTGLTVSYLPGYADEEDTPSKAQDDARASGEQEREVEQKEQINTVLKNLGISQFPFSVTKNKGHG